VAQFEIALDSLTDVDRWPDRCARCCDSGTKLVPVPKRWSKRTEGFAIPLCEKHFDDWSVVGFRTRIGALVILAFIPGSMFFWWTLHPHIAKAQDQNEAARWSSMLAFGFLGVLPLGGLIAWWAKTPIRALGVNGRLVTIGGVCRAFARMMTSAAASPLPIVSDAARFEVHPYSPQRVVPTAKAGNALAILFTLAAVLGSAVGFGGRELVGETAGWDPSDWRYAALSCGVALAYTLPLFGSRMLFSRVGLAMAMIIVAGVLAGLGVARIAGSMAMGFSLVYCSAPLILQQFLAQRLIWRWKLRSTVIAVAAGAGSACAFTAFVMMFGGLEAGPHRAALALGPLFAIFSAALSRSAATAPFCGACDAWLVERRIGALPKSLLQVEPIVASGQVLALADVTPYPESAAIGDVELKLHSCEACREAGTVVLELFDCVKSGKSGTQPLLKRAGRWEYPGASLPAIEALYPPADSPLAS
jgi:hypothetical protein